MIAVLLMVGIAAFTVPTPEFGPAILGDAALGADPAALLAGGAARANGLLVRARLEIGLLLLTTYAGLILFVLLVLFMLSASAAARSLDTIDPWLAASSRSSCCFRT